MNRASWIRQLGIYTWKSFRQLFYEKKWTVLISTLVIDLLLLLVLNRDKMFVEYMDTRTGLFAIACACIWIGLFNSVQSICRERETVKHEHMMSNLSLSSYICARLVYEAVICFFEAILTGSVMLLYFNEAVHNSIFAPFDLFISLWMLIFAADSCGILISSISKTPEMAMTIMPFVLIVQLIMSGFIFELKGITKAVSMITISKWGMRTLCVCCKINQYPPEEIKSYEYGIYHQNIAEYSTGGARIFFLWFVLLLFVTIFSALSVLALQFVDKDKR